MGRAAGRLGLRVAGVLLIAVLGCATPRSPGADLPPPPADPRPAATPADPLRDALERQARELASIDGARVVREQDALLVTFPGDLLFGVASAGLSANAYARLRELAASLERHPATQVAIKGHASADGAPDYNFALSEQRAESVRQYLVAEGVSPERLTAVGFGSQFPVASNATAPGRARNRRVEIEIRPSDALRSRAAGGDGTHGSDS